MDNNIPQRDQTIDSLRGLAILVMILTHVTVFYPSDILAYRIWDWSHFSVPIFIFCSAYLFLQKYKDKPIHFFSYSKKRIVRLVLPYYLFLPFFFLLLWFLKPQSLTPGYILDSLLLIGGVDINWLVLLFLFITLLLPLFVFLLKKGSFLLWLWFLVALASSLLFLFTNPPFSYKIIMWLPWSLMLFFSFFFLHYERQRKQLFLLCFLLVIVFLTTYLFRLSSDQSVVLIHNKYPPNLLYLSYGTAVLLMLSVLVKKMQSPLLLKIIHYFSKYSYQLYFIHYLWLTLLAAFLPRLGVNWVIFFLILVAVTVATQKLITFAQGIRKNRG